MKIFLDTSVLIAALIKTHSAHAVAIPWLQRVKDGTDQGVVAAHSLAEVYATITRLPLTPIISPMLALQLIHHNIISNFQIVALSAADYPLLLDHLATLGIRGGAVYDGLLLQAAYMADVDHIITLNERDFRRVYPPLAHKLIVPQ